MPLSATHPPAAAPALRLGALRLTHGALAKAAAEAAGGLARLPRRSGFGLPLAALVLGNAAPAPVWLTAALRHGIAVAVLDPAWPPALIAAVLDRLNPDLTLHAGAILPPQHPALDTRRAALDPGPPPAAGGGDQPFLIGFTSGSTGLPKAYLRRRAAWRASLRLGQPHFGLTPDSATLAPGPLAHGLTLYALAETLHAGACFTGLPAFGATAMAEALAGQRRLVVVPTMAQALVAHHAATGARFPDLTGITCAGARLDPGLIDRLAGPAPAARVTEYYGASELGFVTTATHPPGRADPTLGCGTPFPGVALRLREGRVWVNSPLTLDAYLWGDGTGLACDGPWRSVGDLGRLDGAGRLHLMGRADGMILSGGHNIYPEEVARVLAAAPGVEGAEALGRPDAYLGQRLEAVLTLAPDARPAAILAHAAQALPRAKLPRRLWAAAALPRTASGKTARAELARWLDIGDPRLTLIWPEVPHD